MPQRSSWFSSLILDFEGEIFPHDCHLRRLQKRDFFCAVRTGNLLAQGVSGKFDVLLAEEAGHFQVFRFAQGDRFLTVRTGYLLAEVLNGKSNMNAAGGTRHF
jgi:hypothetical protein